MKKQYILFLFLFSICSLAQENIIPNGGFEQYAYRNPVGWYFGRYLNFTRDRDAHSGRYSAKIWANGDTFVTSKPGEFNMAVADVKGNSQYNISYWHKGNLSKENVILSVHWFKDNQLIKTEVLEDEQILTLETKWQKKEVSVLSPVGVNKVGIGFELKHQEGKYVLIDDVEMVFVEENEDNKLSAPTGINAKSHQREIEIFWDKEADDDLFWEVQVDDQAPQKTKNNFYTIDNLQMETYYNLRIRAVKGNKYSDFSPVRKVYTRGMNYSEDSIERVPHLRTLGRDGECPQSIKLYFYDLATSNAIIQYLVDGINIAPVNNTLVFPKKGQQKLKLIIEETQERQWQIEYDIYVK